MTERTGAPLSARELPALLDRLHASLCVHRETIDELNVFPVPDGDTGTNMTLTVRASLEALRELGRAPGAELSRAVIRGAVRGARGNSGVILSQVVRAVVEVITGHRAVDARLYAEALARARDLAYEAVAEPVEGTILTVISAAADQAAAVAGRGGGLLEASSAACEATSAAVQRTREQLDVLRDAGVVDAGALGFEVLLNAVHGHLTGEEPLLDDGVVQPLPAAPARHDGCAVTATQPFEVQYLLDAEDGAAAPLRKRLEQLGDSVVVVAAGGLLNVHVHTAEVGPVIEEGLGFGRPSAIEVTHLGDQVAAVQEKRATRLGVVAVVAGDGLVRLVRSTGATVVPGGAGELPAVADLVEAVVRLPTRQVAVLPGHPNAVATARRAAVLAAEEAGHRVTVIDDAVSPPAVLAALAVLSPDAPPETAFAELAAAAGAVRAGEVVASVRDASTPLGDVREGQPLAVAGGEVVAVCEEPIEALERLCLALGTDGAEVVTLIVGADVDAAERDAAVALVERFTGAELEVVDGGQRPARYWVGAE